MSDLGKEPFKRGERVAFYDAGKRKVGIVDAVDNDFIGIKVDREFFAAHPKQLRRLRPKKRREFLIMRNKFTGEIESVPAAFLVPSIDTQTFEVIRVREVLEKKK